MFNSGELNMFEDGYMGVPQIMRTDILEKDGYYLLEIELPGYTHEDVQAELKDGHLTIIADRPAHLEKEDQKVSYLRRERLVGGCKRSFFVGDKVKEGDITAAFKDGVLSIIINNTERELPREDRKLIPIA